MRTYLRGVLKTFARKVLSESKAAILFFPYITTGADGKPVSELRTRILSVPKRDDVQSDFYPHFNDMDDMDAFTHRYHRTVDGQVRQGVTIWTAETTVTATLMNGGWEILQQPNPFGKIPVVYADVYRPEWDDVAVLMDTREMRLSRMKDTNDYNADPILKTFDVYDLPNKDSVGKEISFSSKVDPETNQTYHGDAEYLTWSGSQPSVDKELEETKAEMYGGSSTPDLSFDNLKGLGNLSGVSRKFMLLDAKIKASDHMETFGPVITRCISVVTAGISRITNIRYAQDLKDNLIDVEFGSILPDDLSETMQILSMANGGKPVNSQRTVTAQSPYTNDLEEEMRLLGEEEKASAERNSLVGMTF